MKDTDKNNKTVVQKIERLLLMVTITLCIAFGVHLLGAEFYRALHMRNTSPDMVYKVLEIESKENIRDEDRYGVIAEHRDYNKLEGYDGSQAQQTVTQVLEQSVAESRFPAGSIRKDSFYSNDSIAYGGTDVDIRDILSNSGNQSVSGDDSMAIASLGDNSIINDVMVMGGFGDISESLFDSIAASRPDAPTPGYNPPNYVGSKPATKPFETKAKVVATDNDDGSRTIRNPRQISKRDVLYWYDRCSIYAAVAKHCYVVGYNGGHPSDATIDVNNLIGHYYDRQYINCWWLAEEGIYDKKSNYSMMDTDTIMMLIDDRCKNEK